MKTIYLLFVLILVPFISEAQQETLEKPQPGIIDTSDDLVGKRYPEFDKDKQSTRQWEWRLPFMAQKVIDKGFNLPRPYGVSLVTTFLHQYVDLSALQVSFDPSKPLQDIGFVSLSDANAQNMTWQLKFDAWVLPFLNVYGLVGSIEGTGSVNVGISAKEFFDGYDPNICSGGVVPDFCQGYINATAPMKYYGTNVGIGALVATAYKEYFFAMPMTYVVTDLSVSTEHSYTFNAIPRLGYNLKTEQSGRFGIYLGANYFQSHANLVGTFVLPMASSPIGHDVSLNYKIHSTPVDIWNAIAGVNWEISDKWSAVLEVGYSEHRNMQTIVFGYRF